MLPPCYHLILIGQRAWALVGVGLIFFLLACNSSFLALPDPPGPPSSLPPAVATMAPEAALVDAAGLDFVEKRGIEVYERVSPSVVNISTQVLQRGFFFETIPAAGAGSGFVVDDQGHIITNFHVIQDAQRIEVTFLDETTLPADLVGADPRNDLAVLKVQAPAELLTPAELGSSASLKVGQRAIVIGNPFGQFGGTLTEGVISALNRRLESPDGRQISGVIQTDAAINQGNSGGPLLDSSGRVIGINTAIFSPSGTNSGLGFAVPVDTARRILPDLISLGRYRHPWLGIRFAYRLTPDFARRLNLPVSEGLLIVELGRGSPLAGLDIQGAQQEVILGNQRLFIGGDIITAVDGVSVTSLEDLEILLETNYQVGDTVEVTVFRGSQEQTLQVELAEEPVR